MAKSGRNIKALEKELSQANWDAYRLGAALDQQRWLMGGRILGGVATPIVPATGALGAADKNYKMDVSVVSDSGGFKLVVAPANTERKFPIPYKPKAKTLRVRFTLVTPDWAFLDYNPAKSEGPIALGAYADNDPVLAGDYTIQFTNAKRRAFDLLTTNPNKIGFHFYNLWAVSDLGYGRIQIDPILENEGVF